MDITALIKNRAVLLSQLYDLRKLMSDPYIKKYMQVGIGFASNIVDPHSQRQTTNVKDVSLEEAEQRILEILEENAREIKALENDKE